MPAKHEPRLPQAFPGLTLQPNERLLGALRPDLDDSLRFSPGLVLLSDEHVHVREPAGGFRNFPVTATVELLRHEHGGLTELSFVDHGQRLLRVYFTLAVAIDGNDFMAAFEETRGRHSQSSAPPDED